MRKKIIERKLMITSLIVIMILSLIPIVNSNEQKTDQTTIQILNNTNGSMEKNNITLSNEAVHYLILELMKTEVTPSNFHQEIKNKLMLLQNNGFISIETANQILNNFNILPKTYLKTNAFVRRGVFFDVANVFSGTFFGLKGEKDFTLLNLTMYKFPFFSGNINAGFYGWNRFTGNGTIFTMGFLGFKYLYDFNNTKYDFPYFPQIRGSTFGYTGLLIYFENLSDSEGVDGPFIIGIGMSIATIWNNYQPLVVLKDN